MTGAGDGTAPLDLEVIAIRPNWLVGTFAFHPMLGFRRSQQAASIAHGCASTLLHLARVLNDPGKRDWAAGWGIHVEAVPLPEVALRPDPYEPLPVAEGECWFRKGTPCPFSRRQLEALPNELKIPSATVKELDGVYRLCGRRETHRARS